MVQRLSNSAAGGRRTFPRPTGAGGSRLPATVPASSSPCVAATAWHQASSPLRFTGDRAVASGGAGTRARRRVMRQFSEVERADPRQRTGRYNAHCSSTSVMRRLQAPCRQSSITLAGRRGGFVRWRNQRRYAGARVSLGVQDPRWESFRRQSGRAEERRGTCLPDSCRTISLTLI